MENQDFAPRRSQASLKRFSSKRFSLAAKSGDIGGLRAELALRAKPEDRARALNNALSQAAQRGHTAAALYLMDCGADLRASREGALALAVWNDCLDTVEALIDRGADVRDCALIHRVLETSVRENKLEMARLLLDRGVPPQESNSYPLRMALGLKLPAMARLLVERGADLSELLPEEREALEQLLKEPV